MGSQKRIILNWGPPAHTAAPSPAMSILKSYLNFNGFDVDIHYWNLYLDNLYLRFLGTNTNDYTKLLLFYNYLAIYKNDTQTYKRIKLELASLIPDKINQESDYFDNWMHTSAQQLDQHLNEMIAKFTLTEILYFGFSVNLYQWLFTSIVAEKIKKIDPAMPIIIGGIGSKNTAIAFLENFPQFDIAVWGEGETALQAISAKLRNKDNSISLADYSNIVYRENGKIKTADHKKIEYVDLSSPALRPDYFDYFIQKKFYNIQLTTHILTEGSRSCHWKRCHFCYLNSGYRFRTKTITAIVDETLHMIEKYNIFDFGFLDNDLIAGDIDRFDRLLDKFIEIKQRYPKFRIGNSEIITKNLPFKIIKKMAIAGFHKIQIGYESPSSTLLKKIDKKNTFASNLFLIKHAHTFQINCSGANIITNLLEETEEDIYEAVENLDFLRFVLSSGFFRHNIITLGVNSSSKYFPKVKDKIATWEKVLVKDLLIKDYIQEKDWVHIIEFANIVAHPHWNSFKKIENYYITHKHEYRLFNTDGNILYKEFCQNVLIKEILFPDDSIEKAILTETDQAIRSLQDLLEIFHTRLNKPVDENKLKSSIENLTHKRLVYHTGDFSEILSIINMNLAT